MYGDTDKKHKYEEVRWSLSHSSLTVHCMCVSAFRFPVVGILGLVAITTTRTALFTRVWYGSVALWARATCQYHVKGTDTVGQSVNACDPVDHNSVGLAQARPNINLPGSPHSYIGRT